MWARKRIDIGWRDLAAGLGYCLTRRRRPAFDDFACLSVRSGFDCLLGALNFPPGSEVMMSALTIPDMARIVEARGLVPVPVDLDIRRMAPVDLERARTPATRVLLVAHLFGGRLDMEPLRKFAGQHGLLLVEDCAQAFDGALISDADVSMYSFGPIKTATALGGAILRVRDGALRERMTALQASWPVQGRLSYALRILKYAVLKAVSGRVVFGILVALLGGAHDRLLNRAVRGFANGGFRRSPSAPLLAMMARRLRTFDGARIERRRHLARRFTNHAAVAGAHWVLPVLSDDPRRLIEQMRAAGFDATQGDSMAVVEPPPGRPEATEARRALARIVYLPLYPEMTDEAMEQMARVLRPALATSP